MADSPSLTIGQLAERTGASVDTIRYYERRGLLPEPPRRDSGYREYPEESAARLRFIRRSKEVGFSLREISSLLTLRVEPETSCSEVRQQARSKISEIESKMLDLERMKGALEEITAACSGKGPTSECPILDALSGV